MILLDGKKLSQELIARFKVEVALFPKKPGLTVILVGDDPASHVYVKNKDLACQKVGINSQVVRLPSTTSREELISAIQKLNKDSSVHGILVQLPLPKHLDAEEILSYVSEAKDVDGFHTMNAGKLFRGLKSLVPCTPKGVIALMKEYNVPIKGKHAVVLGRSNIVGKPMAQLLLNEDATVTICHRYSENVEKFCQQADIIVAAVGKCDLIRESWVKKGACVIDVGINRTPDGKMCGDVSFDEVSKKAGWITPVPGGVGPMTIAMLLENTIQAFKSLTAK